MQGPLPEDMSLQENKKSGGRGAAGPAQARHGEGLYLSADQVTSRAHRERQDPHSASTAPEAICPLIGYSRATRGPWLWLCPRGSQVRGASART